MQSELAPVPGTGQPGSTAAARTGRHLTVVPEPRHAGARALTTERYLLITADLVALAVLATVAGGGWRGTLRWIAPILLTFAAAGLYRPRLRYAVLDQLPAMLAGVGLAVAVNVCLHPGELLPPRLLSGRLFAWVALTLAALVVGRTASYQFLHWRRARRRGVRTIVIGSGDQAIAVARGLRAEPTAGLTPIGLVGPDPAPGRELPVPMLGPVETLDRIISTQRPDVVVLTLGGQPDTVTADADVVRTMRQLRAMGITVYVVPRMYGLPTRGLGAEVVQGIPLVRLRPEPANRWRLAVKRLIDIAGAGIGLLFLAPVFAVCALAVRFESGRGVVFKQQRIGLAGKPFTIMKFRSLTPASTVESQVRWTIANDDRVGPVGRVLRGTSLDELPQLVNVLRGDMSLVGPRPERPYFVEQFERAYDGYGDRHLVPAGITGWAQIHGLRGDTSIEDRVRFDNYYVENWSLGLDIKIIVRTVGSMLSIRRR